MDSQEAQVYYLFIITIATISILVCIGIGIIVGIMKKYKAVLSEKIVIEIEAIEDERQRIADDLHDEPGTLLASTKMLLATLDYDDEESKEVIMKCIECVDECMIRLRNISRGLTPVMLQEKGLKAAIEENIGFVNNNAIQISFSSPDVVAINEGAVIHVYRIIQEIIQNTFKHANAKQLSITIERKENGYILLTADDGDGFVIDKKLNKGHGMELLKRRTALIGGKFRVLSRIGKGTSYNIWLPVKM